MSAATRTYDVFGHALRVGYAQASVAAAIDLRLRPWSLDGTPPPDLRVEIDLADPDLAAAIARQPAGAARPIYDMPAGTIRYHPGADVLTGETGPLRLRCEPAAGLLRIAAASTSDRAAYLATHPLMTIGLIELLKRRQRFSLHAACLTLGGRGVLLAGASGSGKSTLALALARGGLGYLGDDMAFLEHTADGVRALGFPDAVGVTPSTAARFSQLASLATKPLPPGYPKHLVRIEEAFAATLATDCVPAALVFPEIVPDDPSRLGSLDPREAWLRLVPDVLLTHPAATQAHLAALAGLLEQVSCHHLRSGPDIEQSAELVAALL